MFGCGYAERRATGAGRCGAGQHRWQLRHPDHGRLRAAGALRRRASAAVAAVVPDRPGGDAAERPAGQRGHLHQGPHRAAGQLPGGRAPPGLSGLRGHRGGQRPGRRRGGRPGGRPQRDRDQRRSAAARGRGSARAVLGAQHRAGRRLGADRRLPGRRRAPGPALAGRAGARVHPRPRGRRGQRAGAAGRARHTRAVPVRAVRRAQQGPRPGGRGLRRRLARPAAPAVPAARVRRRRVDGLRPGGAAADRRVRRGAGRGHARPGRRGHRGHLRSDARRGHVRVLAGRGHVARAPPGVRRGRAPARRLRVRPHRLLRKGGPARPAPPAHAGPAGPPRRPRPARQGLGPDGHDDGRLPGHAAPRVGPGDDQRPVPVPAQPSGAGPGRRPRRPCGGPPGAADAVRSGVSAAA